MMIFKSCLLVTTRPRSVTLLHVGKSLVFRIDSVERGPRTLPWESCSRHKTRLPWGEQKWRKRQQINTNRRSSHQTSPTNHQLQIPSLSLNVCFLHSKAIQLSTYQRLCTAILWRGLDSSGVSMILGMTLDRGIDIIDMEGTTNKKKWTNGMGLDSYWEWMLIIVTVFTQRFHWVVCWVYGLCRYAPKH